MGHRTEDRFVHLHVHSDHSKLDSIAQAKALCAAAAADGQPAVASTDHGSLSGAWRFAQAAKAAGVKPVLGCEMYLAFGSRFERNTITVPAEGDSDAEGESGEAGTKRKAYMHLTVLARTKQGWLNLVAMHNAAYDSYWYYPRIDFDLLREHAEGLIVLTGCLGGPVAGPLSRGEDDVAYANARELIDMLGAENVYVELMDHGIPSEQAVVGKLVKLAADLGLRSVVTNDCHYVHESDASAHDAWLCVSTDSTIETADRFRFNGSGYFLASAQQMRDVHPDKQAWLDACDETVRLAERVEEWVLPESRLRLPKFGLPDGYRGTSADFLFEKVKTGATDRYGDELDEQGRPPLAVRQRLDAELQVINDMGYADYFLIVGDLIEWARSDRGVPTPEFPTGEPGVKKPILVGPGRGSAAGTLVGYTTGIVGVDPLRYGLLFERFLEPGRAGMPDIDFDVEQRRRGELVDYIAAVYGADRVALIGSYGIVRSKQAIKDAARVCGVSAASAEVLTKMIPVDQGKPTALSVMVDPSFDGGGEFRSAVAASEQLGRVVELARSFEGVVRQLGIHACGILISDQPLAELGVPLRWETSGPMAARVGHPITCWDGLDVGDDGVGLLKMDALSLRNLDIVAACVDNIAHLTGEVIDVAAIPDPDSLFTGAVDPDSVDGQRVKAAWDLLCLGRTSGVFQLDSTGITELTTEVAPHSLEDLSAIMALYRPGPMGASMHTTYARRKRREEEVDYGIYTQDRAEQAQIALELDNTFGTCTYQEQLMALGSRVAGFDMAEKSRLRKAFSKKKQAEMDAVRDIFFAKGQVTGTLPDGSAKMAFKPSTLAELWRTFDASASYLFNKCLSGETVLSTGSWGHLTIRDLYDRLNEIDHTGSTPTCRRCAKPALKGRGVCKGHQAWHEKFHSPSRGLTLLAIDSDGRIRPKRVKDVHYNGVREVFLVTLADGRSVKATSNHRFLTPTGWQTVENTAIGDQFVTDGGFEPRKFTDYRLSVGERSGSGRLYAPGEDNIGYIDGGSVKLKEWTRATFATRACGVCQRSEGRLERAHLDGNRTNNEPDNLAWLCPSHHKKHDYQHNGRAKRWSNGHVAVPVPVVSIESAGFEDVFDVEMDDPGHNFVANGIISHNSHSVAYAKVGYWTAYLKANWPTSYAAAVLAATERGDKRDLALTSMARDGIEVRPPRINEAQAHTFPAADGSSGVLLGLGEIKNVGAPAAAIVAERESGGSFTGVADLVSRVQVPSGEGFSKLNAKAVEALIGSGALDEFGPRLGLMKVWRALAAGAQIAIPQESWSPLDEARVQRALLGVITGEHPLMDQRYLDAVSAWRVPNQFDSFGRSDVGQGVSSLRALLVGEIPNNKDVCVPGLLAEWKPMASKRGRRANFRLEGPSGAISGVMWPSDLSRLSATGGEPQAGDLVVVSGRSRETTRSYVVTDEEGNEVEMSTPRRELTVKDLWVLRATAPAVEPAGPRRHLSLVREPADQSQSVSEAALELVPSPSVRPALVAVGRMGQVQAEAEDVTSPESSDGPVVVVFHAEFGLAMNCGWAAPGRPLPRGVLARLTTAHGHKIGRSSPAGIMWLDDKTVAVGLAPSRYVEVKASGPSEDDFDLWLATARSTQATPAAPNPHLAAVPELA